MSLFHAETTPCPNCRKPIQCEVVYSVNGDRRPDLRAAILDDSIQRGKCSQCSNPFRIPPELTYFDLGRKQWILVQPADKLPAWIDLEQAAQAAFERAYGLRAVPAARAMGKGMRARTAFGWPALREKVLCGEHQIDDAVLELMKLAIIRASDSVPFEDSMELRLLEVKGKKLPMAWINSRSEFIVEQLEVPRELYDEIAADNTGWQALRREVTAGPFVDLHRLLIPQEKEIDEPSAVPSMTDSVGTRQGKSAPGPDVNALALELMKLPQADRERLAALLLGKPFNG